MNQETKALTETVLDRIFKDAEENFPCKYNEQSNLAYFTGATAEAARSEPLVALLERFLNYFGSDDQVKDTIEEALSQYNHPF